MAKHTDAEKAALKFLKRSVKDRMDDDGVEVHDVTTPIAKVRRRFERGKARLILVRRGEELIGMLAPRHLPEKPAEDEQERALDSLPLPALHALSSRDDLVEALTTMLRHDYRVMPVQSTRHPGKIVGLLRRQDLDKVARAVGQRGQPRPARDWPRPQQGQIPGAVRPRFPGHARSRGAALRRPAVRARRSPQPLHRRGQRGLRLLAHGGRLRRNTRRHR